MADKIQIKRSAVDSKVPTTANLDLGELAINTFDGKLYSKKNDGAESVFRIGPVDSVNGQEGVVSLDSDDVDEGTGNLYFTEARAQNSISVSGDLSYSNGVISFSETYSNGKEVNNARLGNFGNYYSSSSSENVDEAPVGDIGLYSANLAGSFPSGSGFFFITTQKQYNNNAVVQHATSYHTSTPVIAYRHTESENPRVWTDWVHLHHSGNFDPSTKLDTTAKAADSDLLDGNQGSDYILKSELSNIAVNTEVEEVTLSASQTTINLSTITLTTNRPQLYVEGSFEQDFTVTNSTTIELGESFPAGTRVFILQNTLSF